MGAAIVTTCNTSQALEFSEHTLDLVALAKERFAISVLCFTSLARRDAGFIRYLTKPMQIDEIVKTIKAVIDGPKG
ncbi:MAG: hypothetical protein H8E36_11770 [Rhodospirillaceae bacterium]|nr:hypothetical protein [Rhodospirillaceae bacterium]